MSDPNWSEFPNPWVCFKELELKLKLKLESKLEQRKLDSKLGQMKGLSTALQRLLRMYMPTVDGGSLTNFLLNPVSSAGVIPHRIVFDHSKWITSNGEHKAWEELQQCERKLQERQENFFEKIEGGYRYIEYEFEGLKLSLKRLEMLKHLVQSTLMEPMRDAVVLMTLMYIVVLSYSLAQVRNDWLIHFLVLCAFVCLHIGSYFSEKAATHFYRVKEMEKKLMERWPLDVVLYLHLASPTCVLLST